MQLAFALFADAANLSLEGKLNVLGVFDAVQVGGLPAVHPRAHVVVRLKADRNDVGRHRLVFRWLDPAGQELWSSEGELEVTTPPPGVSTMDVPVIAAVDLPLPTAGDYTMMVGVDGHPAGTIPLSVYLPARPMMAPRPATLVS